MSSKMSNLRATITPDGKHVHLSGQLWSETFPVERLAAKIAFYEGLRDRKGGQFAQHYDPTVKALRSAEKIHHALTRRKEA